MDTAKNIQDEKLKRSEKDWSNKYNSAVKDLNLKISNL